MFSSETPAVETIIFHDHIKKHVVIVFRMLKIKNIEDRFLHNMSATGTFILWRLFYFQNFEDNIFQNMSEG